MSNNTPATTEALTGLVSVTSTGEAKDLGAESIGQRTVICSNNGANPAFVRSGSTNAVTTTFPTTVASSYGQIVLPGTQVVYTKRDASDRYLFCICGSGLTTDLYTASSNGR